MVREGLIMRFGGFSREIGTEMSGTSKIVV